MVAAIHPRPARPASIDAIDSACPCRCHPRQRSPPRSPHRRTQPPARRRNALRWGMFRHASPERFGPVSHTAPPPGPAAPDRILSLPPASPSLVAAALPHLLAAAQPGAVATCQARDVSVRRAADLRRCELVSAERSTWKTTLVRPPRSTPSRSRSMKTAIAHWHGTADANWSRTRATCETLSWLPTSREATNSGLSAAMFLIYLPETHISEVGI